MSNDDRTVLPSIVTGTVEWIQIDIDENDEGNDYLIIPVAMVRQ